MKFSLFLFLACCSHNAFAETSKAKITNSNSESTVEVTNPFEKAQSELQLPSNTTSSAEGSGATVSVADLVAKAEDPYQRSRWEMEILAQNFSPKGSGTLSNGETFSLNSLPEKPLIGLQTQYWFVNYQEFREKGWRWGGNFQLLGSSQAVNIRSNNGFQYQDVRIFDLFYGLGPQIEAWIPLSAKKGILGLSTTYGQVLRTQSHANSLANTATTAWWFSPAAHIRAEISKNIFAKLQYSWRKTVASSSLETQENNYIAALGFSI